jgi:antitoxin component of RelBE/YafQ-DinJ toxin-antitoxin module
MPRSNKDRVITLRVDEQTKNNLMEAAASTGLCSSNLIRLCVKAELQRIKERYGKDGSGK